MHSPSEAAILAIDVGTSAVKAALVDATGATHGVGRSTYPTRRTADGGFCQKPRDWWRSLRVSVGRAVAEQRPGAIRALVISSQIGTHLLATADGRALTEAVTWQDSRSIQDQCEIERNHDRSWLAASLGIDLPRSANWPLARLRWFARSDPALFSRARYLLQPKEYLIGRLTGIVVGDPSSWRGLAHPRAGVPHRLLRELGIEDKSVPMKSPTDVAGTLRDDVARRLGLEPGLLVFVGWNDLNCSLLGAGVVVDGQAFDIAGTSEHVGRVLALREDVGGPDGSEPPQLMRGPFGFDDALPSVARYGVSSNGGSVVEWLRHLEGGRARGTGQIERLASQSPAGGHGLLFLPYLLGERAPVWDPQARGAFVGLTSRHTWPDMARAALEGVAFNLRQILDLVDMASPHDAAAITAAGGPARMTSWNQIKADVFGRPVDVPRETDVAVVGAAMIAATGMGWYRSLSAAAAAMRQQVDRVYPNERTSARYAALYDGFRQLHPALAGLHRQLAGIQAGTDHA
jgi:xylulokinase